MTPGERPVLLVTSIGSGVTEAIIRAARLSRHDPWIVGVGSGPPSAGSTLCDETVRLPPTRDPAFLEALLQAAARARPALVLAGRDDDIAPLAEARARLAELGAWTPGPPAGLAATFRDKLEGLELLRREGVAVCQTVADEAGLREIVEERGLPIVVKPRRGDGSRGVAIAATAERALELLEDGRGAMVAQPFIGTPPDGPIVPPATFVQRDEYSSELILLAETTIGPFTTRNDLVAGNVTRAEPVDDPAMNEVATTAARVLRAHGVTGVVNVQGRRRGPGEFEIFEANLRCTGLSGARADMGFNDVEALLGQALGEPPPPPDIGLPGLGQAAYLVWSFVVGPE